MLNSVIREKQREILTAMLGDLWRVDILRICPSQRQREKDGEKFLFST